MRVKISFNISNIKRKLYSHTLFLFVVSLVFGQLVTLGVTDAGPYFTEYSSTNQPKFYMTSTSGSGGSVWYSSYNTGASTYALSDVSPSGAITDYSILPSGYTRVSNVTGLVTDSSGNVWFHGCATTTSGTNNIILGKLTPSTGAVTATPHSVGNGCGPTWMPGPLAIDSSGYIWAAVQGNGMSGWIDRFNSSGTYSGYYWQDYSPTVGDRWTSMSTGPGNTLWLTDGVNNRIHKLTLSSTDDKVSAVATYTLPTASSSPGSIVAGSDGNMWVALYGGSKIEMVTPSGAFTDFAIPSGNTATEVALGSDGAVWFTEFAGNRIGRISTTGAVTEYVVPTASSAPWGITAGPDGAIWFTEKDANQVGRLGY